MTTFLASTFLHGFNFQLGAVLLSLGFFIYVEDRLRNKLATKFDASIRARRRPEDNFRHSEASFRVMLFNMLFVMLSMVHLMYLGVMFDQSDVQAEGYRWTHTIAKWDSLSFFSHWFMLLSLMLSFLFWNTMQFFRLLFARESLGSRKSGGKPWRHFSYIIRRALQIPIFSSQCTFACLLHNIWKCDEISRFLVFFWCFLSPLPRHTLLDVDNFVKSHIRLYFGLIAILIGCLYYAYNAIEGSGTYFWKGDFSSRKVFALDAFTAAFQLSEKSGETLGKSQKRLHARNCHHSVHSVHHQLARRKLRL